MDAIVSTENARQDQQSKHCWASQQWHPALLVIPKLKLSDLGLFDAERFAFVE